MVQSTVKTDTGASAPFEVRTFLRSRIHIPMNSQWIIQHWQQKFNDLSKFFITAAIFL